jgi:hypothetical protein
MMSERGSSSNDGFLERRTEQEKSDIKVTAGSCIHCTGAIYVEKTFGSRGEFAFASMANAVPLPAAVVWLREMASRVKTIASFLFRLDAIAAINNEQW